MMGMDYMSRSGMSESRTWGIGMLLRQPCTTSPPVILTSLGASFL